MLVPILISKSWDSPGAGMELDLPLSGPISQTREKTDGGVICAGPPVADPGRQPEPVHALKPTLHVFCPLGRWPDRRMQGHSFFWPSFHILSLVMAP